MQPYFSMVHRHSQRQFWIDRIEADWKKRPVIWLSGVRRVGKTYLCQSLPKVEYFDCELPRVRRMMEDPEGFLDEHDGKRIVLDEIHRLQNPSELLKIAADHYPGIRILATGSSTLSASTQFKDTLAGRKRDLWLTPMCLRDLKSSSMKRRLLRGGLPPFYLADEIDERDYQEWMDAYWAKDIQELFRLERRDSFQKFTELVLSQSGGIFEATRFTGPCEVSRPTVANYLRVLEATFVAHIVRPFSSRKAAEIISAPKVYGFDTGFICYYRGWNELRNEDLGVLWEHFVLNEMMTKLQSREVGYWRDKRGHEVDFILSGRRKQPIAIECKWSLGKSEGRFDPKNLQAFRRQHPGGENVVLAQDVKQAFTRKYGALTVRFAPLEAFVGELT